MIAAPLRRAVAVSHLVFLVFIVAVGLGCITEETGDLALCCTCLDQRSPIEGSQDQNGDAIDARTNCLVPQDGEGSEVDRCNAEAGAFIAREEGAQALTVIDEACHTDVCADECRGAILRGVEFEVDEQSVSG